jgi:cytoskeletal protein CcmA (bactofilin family)
MGLVVSNISGSFGNGEVLDGQSLIAVTGAIAFGTDGALLPAVEELAATDVHFYVHDAAQFADAVYIDGALSADSLELAGDLTVDGNTILGSGPEDSLVVSASARFEAPVDMKDGLVVTGTLFISDDLASGGLVVEGDVLMIDDVNIEGTLFVTGAVELDSTLLIKEDLTVDGTTMLNNTVDVTAGGLFVTGGLYIDGDIALQSDDHAATKGYVDGLVGGGFTIDGNAVGTNTGTSTISGGNTLGLTGSVDQIEITIAEDSLTFALAPNVTITGDFSAASGSFTGDLDVDGDVVLGTTSASALTVNATATFNEGVTIEGDLTVRGTTTTVNSTNVLLDDPFILLARVDGPGLADADGGIIILSGAIDGSDLAIGRVDGDTWGVVKLDSDGGEIENLDLGTLVNFRASEFQIGGDTNYLALDNTDLHLHADDDLILCATGSGEIVMKAFDGLVDTAWLTFNIGNDEILPETDNTISLGSLDNRFRNVYTGDLHLQNDRGSWTLIEEENFISFRNNQTGRRFRMVMEDITDSGTYGPGNDGKL